jgi:hypothetical protein
MARPFVNVLTGGTSGVYYPLGVALSQIYGKALPDAKDHGASRPRPRAENLNLLQAGRGEIGFTLGDALSEAWKGNEEAGFKTPLKKLRTVAGNLPQLHPDRRQRRFRHQDAGRPEGQAHLGRRAEVGHRTQCARHLQGGRPELQGFRQGRIPALRRIGRTDEKPPARRDAAFPPASAWPRSATWPRRCRRSSSSDSGRGRGQDRRCCLPAGTVPADTYRGQTADVADRRRSRTSWSRTRASPTNDTVYR